MTSLDPREYTVQIGTLVVTLLLWQMLAGPLNVIDSVLIPPPLEIFGAFIELAGDPNFQNHVSMTFRRMIIASIFASIPGILLGLAMGWSPTFKALTFPIVSATYPLPKISLLPLFMLIFGIGEQAFIITVAIAAIFMVLYNAMRGINEIGSLYFDVAKDNGVDSTYAYFTEILLPGTLPSILTGLRLTLNIALLVTISVEFVGANVGLGAFIWSSWNTLATTEMYVAVFIVGFAGLLITYGLEWATGYLIPWKQETESAAI